MEWDRVKKLRSFSRGSYFITRRKLLEAEILKKYHCHVEIESQGKDCLAGKTMHAPIEIDDSGINQGSSARTPLFPTEGEKPQHQKSEVYNSPSTPNLLSLDRLFLE